MAARPLRVSRRSELKRLCKANMLVCQSRVASMLLPRSDFFLRGFTVDMLVLNVQKYEMVYFETK